MPASRSARSAIPSPVTVIAALAALCAAPTPAWADIFKCVEADGAVTYSNIAGRNCKRIHLEPLSTIPGGNSAASRPRGAPANGASAAFPKVDDATQKKRDTDRRKILEQELEGEQAGLEQAKKELAEQEAVRHGDERNYQKVLDRLQPYKDRVALHERNIEALRKELGGVR
ncbi:MAG: DUF4124 domain-containing protein [Betaproteobacteria bacterium]|nr:DUF4124 domain-containing protein [Betaproteobacteria bacterium]